MEEQKTEDYKERLQKVRQRRNGKDPMHWFMIGGCAVIVVLAVQLLQISQLAIQAADAGKIGIQHQKTAFVDALVQMYAQ